MRRTFVGVLLLALVVAGVATWRYDLVDRYLRDGEPAANADPVAIAPPAGLELPAVQPPAAVAEAARSAPLSPAKLRRALAPYLADEDLGPHVLAAVAPLAPGPTTLTRGAGDAVPASTTKLVTATAALLALGPEHVFTTRVVSEAGAASGNSRRLVLVGGGDPFLASAPPAADEEPPYPPRADVVDLARRTARALKAQGARRVRLAYDASLFTGPADNPAWERDYVPDGVVSPISALWVDGGRDPSGFGRVADPALRAATAFADALRAAGIRVDGEPVPAAAKADAEPLAAVTSAPLGEIVEHLLQVSDNEATEVLLRHVGLSVVADASFVGGRRGVTRLLAAEGVDLAGTILYDGSGLSRRNRMTPATLIDVLRLATTRPDLGPVLTGLPVAGFTGSLADRFAAGAPEGRGRVRAKTGTLTGVASLAGIVTDAGGRPMLFVLMADRVARLDGTDAEVALDGAAAALAACRCGR
ncbi:D-alanyl-D-alanine carboxypeptidase [Nocardioides psychrotolerans]|uniref:D-alanyl-D-alanine carboxypeptidase / D-alanyl-D-alanine-endopeptidase (Penicillin-binding protein 4) n=1 Tax=Nocardioides psychrotolerans TaxID=1005945 RepID=A0A1I3MYQ3_9ACTN|nr:D-alanyl-D-alanine carboxypeptidase/D-alanyl-D-alanine-endopeptidase [Nocardioides psychrotolerans]GEP39067.1 D-alanyl-D-alanine carboxypeptidase [Nocardioides psychrotolerans]SFJ02244.1 D-alanyl-D-alanine carboxypeptidase / D-alanyl-D-alanine-endopeptidase (penicillin-binding protein 4) [Nocardioides psychrotolerans]